MTAEEETARITGTLGELLPIKYGKSLPASARDSSGSVPVFGSSGLVGAHSHALTSGPTIVVGRKGNVGSIHYSPVPCWPIDTAYFVEPPVGHSASYCRYLLTSLNLSRLDRSTAIPGLSRDDYNAVQVSIHLPGEQQQVVAEIEKQFSRLDEAVANLQRVKANLKRYKAAVLKSAIEGRLVETTSGWSSVVLGDVSLSVRNGCSVKPDAESGTRILRISAVRPLELDSEDVRFLPGTLEDYDPFDVKTGDVLFTRYNGSRDYVGVCAVVLERMAPTIYPDKLIRVRVDKKKVLPEFLAIACSAGQGRDFIKSKIRTTAGQSGVSGADVKAIPMRLPSLDEQKAIVTEADRRLSVLRNVEAEVNANLLRAQVLRRSVLQFAFSEGVQIGEGESVVTEVARNKESASVVVAARVIAQNCEAATFGRVKLQKLLFLSTHHARIEASNDEYARLQAGPADLEMLLGVLKRLNQLRWFREKSREQRNRSENHGYTYERLSLADDYKNHLSAITGDQLKAVDHVCQSLRTWSTEDCELLATVYAAWNDLLLWRHPVSDQALVDELHEHWHESKRRFSVQRIESTRRRLVELGMEPTGFGNPTRWKAAEVVTPRLL